MPFPNYAGKTKVWTKERVDAALRAAAKEIKGPLPSSDRAWGLIKKNRYDLPPAARIYEYYHSMARAWRAIGARPKRINLSFSKWTPEDDLYLLDNAGDATLEAIGKHLGRSYGAVRGRLRWFRIASRHNLGYLSAAELAKEYQCPYHRVRAGLTSGVITGTFDSRRNRWVIDLLELSSKAKLFLTKPRGTWKDGAPDCGDYYQRYALRRKVIEGQVIVVPE